MPVRGPWGGEHHEDHTALGGPALRPSRPVPRRREDLTLCWAAWDPANALVELSKDFEAQSGNKMNFEFVPWPNFADRMLNELNSGGKLCDLMIGDSQWIGGAAENGHYVKLNDFFDKRRHQDGRLRAGHGRRLFRMAEGHAELLGAAGHGRRRRLDLPQGLVRPARAAGRVQGKVRPRSRRARRPSPNSRRSPSSSRAARSTARRSTAPSIYTERGSEGITMGAIGRALPLRLQVRETRTSPTTWKASSTRRTRSRASSSTRRSTIAARLRAHPNGYMGEGIDAFKSGQVAMQMNFRLHLAGLQGRSERRRRQDRLSSSTRPARTATGSPSSAARASRSSSYSDKQDAALDYIKWFAQPDVQKKWWSLGGYLLPARRWSRIRASPTSQPYAADLPRQSMAIVKDFWAEPTYADAAAGDAEALP